MKPQGNRLWVILIVMALSGAVAQGLPATWYVAPTGNDGNAGTGWDVPLATISAGVTKSSNGDTILVSNGTYVVTAQIQVTKSITIQGLTGQRDSIVNGNGASRCFALNNAGALVTGFTITNGYSVESYPEYGGAGMFIDESGGTVSNCTFTDNHATGVNPQTSEGGAVKLYKAGSVLDCTLTGSSAQWGGGGVFLREGGYVRNCLITRNTSPVGGGGVYMITAGIVTNCTITENSVPGNSRFGAGVMMNGQSGAPNPPTVTGCLIANNILTGSYCGGGGVCLKGGRLVNCTISNNWADAYGGGVYSFFYDPSSTGIVENCTITRNYSWNGGGIYVESAGDLRMVRNCLIMGNTAYNGGGGMLLQGVLESCTIVRNRGYTAGGGINAGVSVRATNSIILYNDGPGGSDTNFNDSTTIGMFSYCCLAPYAPPQEGSTNFTFNPLFVDSGSGYGTNAVAGDYHLKWIRVPQQISPCIDAGTNLDWMASATDLDGKARRYNSGIVDIGAYELTPPRPKGTVVLIK